MSELKKIMSDDNDSQTDIYVRTAEKESFISRIIIS